MLEHEMSLVLQTGPFTPPDLLIQELAATPGIQVDARRVGAAFRGGGVGSFIRVTATNNHGAGLAAILHRHTERLWEKGGDNLFILLGGRINTDEPVVDFRDVQFRRQISLKDKSEAEIKDVLSKNSGG